MNGAMLTIRNTSTFTSGGSISIYGNGTLANYGLLVGNFTNFFLECSFLNYGQVLINGSLTLLSDSTSWGQIYISFVKFWLIFIDFF